MSGYGTIDEKIERLLRAVYSSRLRTGIILALADGPMSLSELRRKVGANAPNTSTRARELQQLHLLERGNGTYWLSDLGKLVGRNVSASIRLYKTLIDQETFWLKHSISGIPAELQDGLSLLNGSELIEATEENASLVRQMILKHMGLIEKRCYCILPVFLPEIVDNLLVSLRKGINIKIITQPHVLQKVRDTFKNGNNYDENKINLSLYEVVSDIPFFILSEDFFFLGLKSGHNTTQYLDMTLLNSKREGMVWANQLFQHYATESALRTL